MRRIEATVRTAALFLAVACAPMREVPRTPEATATVSRGQEAIARASAAERLYGNYCATCHGSSGNGRGVTAKYLGLPRPRDLTSGVYKFRSTASGQLPLQADLARTVEWGVSGTVMPGFGEVLSSGDIGAVVKYIEGFSPRFGKEPEAGRAVVPVPTPPKESAEALRRGRLVYLAMGCWNCHGASGRGDGPAAPTLENQDGEPTRATDFRRGVFKGGAAPERLYRTLATGLDGTPMPAYLEALAVVRDLGEDLSALKPVVSAGELAELTTFLGSQPSAEAFYALSDEERARLAEDWRWSLVYYVRSLSGGRSFWKALFGL
ncbi:MAG: c-type cytochrome [Deltaproteobacteria bacterium]|nr:c-type cytochrome [Deltaproteobacteria bacterium]